MFNFVFFFWFQIDEVRINQLYEQAKIQIITEEIDCTEEESITFAALQFQVKVASQNPQGNTSTDEVDDIDSALSELQVNKRNYRFSILFKSRLFYGCSSLFYLYAIFRHSWRVFSLLIFLIDFPFIKCEVTYYFRVFSQGHPFQ